MDQTKDGVYSKQTKAEANHITKEKWGQGETKKHAPIPH
jgi:hypothetical protein